MYNTIIVLTDFSDDDSTIAALKTAETLSDKGRIILLHVLDDIPAYAFITIPPDLIKDIAPNSRDKLVKLVDASKVKAEIEVRNGNPYREIIELAKETKAELIIVNSHKPGFQDYLLGSTAAKVVRHSPSAVLVIR